MFYYISFFFISFLTFSDLLRHEYKKLFFILTITVLFFISALRFGIGLDEDSYRSIYKTISEDYLNGNISFSNYFQEPLFILFNILLIPFKSDQSIYFLFAFLNSLLLFFSYKEFSNYSVIPILIYFSHRFLHNDLNQIRQGLVSLIFLYSLLFIGKKKYIFLNIIGVFIQSGAIIFIIYLFIKKIFSEPKSVFFLICISVCLTKVITNDFLFGYFPEASKILFYLQDERFNYTRNLFVDFTFYKCVIILLLLSLNYKALKNKWNYFTILYSVYVFGLFCMIALHNIALLSGRISSLLFTVEPVLIFYLVIRFKSYFSRFIIYTIVYFYCFLNLFLNLNLENSPVSSYKTILTK